MPSREHFSEEQPALPLDGAIFDEDDSEKITPAIREEMKRIATDPDTKDRYGVNDAATYKLAKIRVRERNRGLPNIELDSLHN